MSRAAEELGVAQSTLSRSVASLEQSWGVRLFDRHGPMLSLTRDGERLLPGCTRPLRGERRALSPRLAHECP